MPTDKQLEANSLNVLQSAGPRTPEGEPESSQNAIRHGFCARTVVLPGENREEFEQLCNDLESEWQPQTATERFLVTQLATSQWKLGRAQVLEAQILGNAGTDGTHLRVWENVVRQQNSILRTYFKALKELQQLRENGACPEPPAESLEETSFDPSSENDDRVWPLDEVAEDDPELSETVAPGNETAVQAGGSRPHHTIAARPNATAS
ncbi:MAG: hypothetical protein U0Q18_36010 [Bryobacteraceae bacterium]